MSRARIDFDPDRLRESKPPHPDEVDDATG